MTTDQTQSVAATARAVNHDQADIWIDALASTLVDRLKEYAGMTVEWSDMRKAIQREVTRQQEYRLARAAEPAETVTEELIRKAIAKRGHLVIFADHEDHVADLTDLLTADIVAALGSGRGAGGGVTISYDEAETCFYDVAYRKAVFEGMPEDSGHNWHIAKRAGLMQKLLAALAAAPSRPPDPTGAADQEGEEETG